MNGVWKLSVGGNTKTYSLSFSGNSFSGAVTSDPKSPKSTITGQIRTGRGKTFISWVGPEQHTDKGLYTAAYAGTVEWQSVTGTYYDEDGSKQFKMTRQFLFSCTFAYGCQQQPSLLTAFRFLACDCWLRDEAGTIGAFSNNNERSASYDRDSN